MLTVTTCTGEQVFCYTLQITVSFISSLTCHHLFKRNNYFIYLSYKVPIYLLIMARHFKEKDIDEFRECFYLFARSDHIKSLDELTVIMRSLGLSPTTAELKGYLKQKGGKMTFPDFLEIMHIHSKIENLPKEVVDAFKAADKEKKGVILAKQLRHLLQNWGERLSTKEVDRIFREANVNNNSMVKYEDFAKIACAPIPDYY